MYVPFQITDEKNAMKVLKATYFFIAYYQLYRVARNL